MITGNIISDFIDGNFEHLDEIEQNGIKYYVLMLSKFIPVIYLENINYKKLLVIQDEINNFLATTNYSLDKVFNEENKLK